MHKGSNINRISERHTAPRLCGKRPQNDDLVAGITNRMLPHKNSSFQLGTGQLIGQPGYVNVRSLLQLRIEPRSHAEACLLV